jgi:DNA-binding CsgD family transcriptional regulator
MGVLDNVGNNGADLNSFESIFRSIPLFGFTLLWRGVSCSWEIENARNIKNGHRKLYNNALEAFNGLDRESDLQSLILSNQSFHCNYFVANMEDFHDYFCVGIVDKYARGKRPSSMACKVYSIVDLLSIANFFKSMLGDLPSPFLGPETSLTTREQDILKLISEGNSQKQMAETLGISNSTVESHKSRLFTKFQVRSSAELIHKAYLRKEVFLRKEIR